MDMFDEARAIKSTMELCHLTQTELAKQLGVSQSYIANKLRLLSFSEKMTEKIKNAGISERHARSLLRLGSEDSVERVLDMLTQHPLTVRELEAIVDSEVMKSIPELIGNAERLDAVESFTSAVKGGCEVLNSRGVDARTRTSYLGDDLYISIVIKNA